MPKIISPTEYELDEVICNGAKAASTAIEYLLSLGHRSIGYIGDCNMESRYSGYYECLLGHRIPLIYDYVVSTGQTREEGYRAYDRLAEKGRQPTAVFCANDVTALGFLQAMKDKTGRKKKDIYRPAVVSIDDIEEASLFSPMLTTVHIPKKDMVHMAVMHVVRQTEWTSSGICEGGVPMPYYDKRVFGSTCILMYVIFQDCFCVFYIHLEKFLHIF